MRSLFVAVVLATACADRTVAGLDDDPEADDPGEQPVAAGAMYSPCTDSSECPDGLCVFPRGEAGFCSTSCSVPADLELCEPTPGPAPATCFDIGLPSGESVCGLDCASAACPRGMRCEQVMSGSDGRSICF